MTELYKHLQGNVVHNLVAEGKKETECCGQRVMTVYVLLNLLICMMLVQYGKFFLAVSE